jgi:hypothetical protein
MLRTILQSPAFANKHSAKKADWIFSLQMCVASILASQTHVIFFLLRPVSRLFVTWTGLLGRRSPTPCVSTPCRMYLVSVLLWIDTNCEVSCFLAVKHASAAMRQTNEARGKLLSGGSIILTASSPFLFSLSCYNKHHLPGCCSCRYPRRCWLYRL